MVDQQRGRASSHRAHSSNLTTSLSLFDRISGRSEHSPTTSMPEALLPKSAGIRKAKKPHARRKSSFGKHLEKAIHDTQSSAPRGTRLEFDVAVAVGIGQSVNVRAKIDTTSASSFVSSIFVKTHNLTSVTWNTPTYHGSQCVCGNSIKADAAYYLDLQLWDNNDTECSTSHTFWSRDTIAGADIILGDDFLSAQNPLIRYRQGIVSWGDATYETPADKDAVIDNMQQRIASLEKELETKTAALEAEKQTNARQQKTYTARVKWLDAVRDTYNGKDHDWDYAKVGWRPDPREPSPPANISYTPLIPYDELWLDAGGFGRADAAAADTDADADAQMMEVEDTTESLTIGEPALTETQDESWLYSDDYFDLC